MNPRLPRCGKGFPVGFTPERFARVVLSHERWWRGELDRPLVHIFLTGARDPGPPPEPYHPAWTAFYGFETPVETIIAGWEHSLSGLEFMGDAFPHVWPNFGPGVAAAMLGAKLKLSVDARTVWFEPDRECEPAERRFVFDSDNAWLGRVGDIAAAADARWGGSVQIGMTDLGGNLDILSSFRPSETLLLDIYDAPGEVKRLTWELHECWLRLFEHLNRKTPHNPGWTCHAPILSKEPYYMLQCDFAYMIGPGMFGEFVLPEIAATAMRLSRAFYHLDGVGQLPHLDALLALPALKGVQWVPGSGEPEKRDWTHVYRRILDAGKLAQATHMDLDGFDRLCGELGNGGRGLFFFAWLPASMRGRAEAFCAKYRIPQQG